MAILGACVLAAGGWAVSRVARAYWIEWASLRPYIRAVIRPTDALGGRIEDVVFRSRDGHAVRGWYVPSRTGAAVVLCHGSESDRTGVLDEARALANAGLGVLLYDAPGTGETGGRPGFGAPERAALLGALDLLAARSDVDPARVGAYGFSLGGYTVAQVAAVDARVRAVVLAGTPADIAENTRAAFARGGRLAVFGALLAQRVAGIDTRTGQPLEVVAAIAPRPLLLVTGGRDAVVPPAVAHRLYSVAGEPKRLLRIERAGHGHYAEADPGYGRYLSAFFERTLATHRDVRTDRAGSTAVLARGR